MEEKLRHRNRAAGLHGKALKFHLAGSSIPKRAGVHGNGAPPSPERPRGCRPRGGRPGGVGTRLPHWVLAAGSWASAGQSEKQLVPGAGNAQRSLPRCSHPTGEPHLSRVNWDWSRAASCANHVFLSTGTPLGLLTHRRYPNCQDSNRFSAKPSLPSGNMGDLRELFRFCLMPTHTTIGNDSPTGLRAAPTLLRKGCALESPTQVLRWPVCVRGHREWKLKSRPPALQAGGCCWARPQSLQRPFSCASSEQSSV